MDSFQGWQNYKRTGRITLAAADYILAGAPSAEEARKAVDHIRNCKSAPAHLRAAANEWDSALRKQQWPDDGERVLNGYYSEEDDE